jgi:tetratricopeptide (TPR) repeat protein
MFDWIKSKLRTPEDRRVALLRQADDALLDGAPEQARQICLAILRRSPDDPHALSLMANIAADLRQVEDGLRWADRAIAADPEAAAPHYSVGRLWELAGQPDRAEASYRQVLSLDPNHAKAHNNLGCVLSLQGKLDEALACYRQALQLHPEQPEANQNYAAMTSDAGAQEVAIQGYLRQMQRDPTDARAFNNLANIYSGLGRNREAMAILEQAIALDPNRAEAHYSRSLLLLSEGNYAAGWEEYEWRWRLDNPLSAPGRRFAQPMWDGRDLGDGALLMHGELALGESLQFVRYARLAAARCGSVIFECAPRLRSLLLGVEGVGQITTPGEALPPFAAHIPLFGLPRVFGTTLQNIPWNGPYIPADPGRVEKWRPLIESAGKARFRVGLVWSGNPQNPYNRDRSIALAALAPVQKVPGVAFYSLQKGEGAANAGLQPAPMSLIDLTAHERDFLDTVAFIRHLDLVITVDTMISALAGAMGARVWVLLNRVPDWRHHLERSDNPWYPTMRLYRQTRGGEWEDVVDRVADDLRQLTST